MTQSPSSSSKSAWVQLYEARRAPEAVSARPPGRPVSPIPRHKIGLTLSQGEIHEIEAWQERLSALLRRKISAGEAVGILTRICSARFEQLHFDGQDQPELADLVEKMIGRE